MEAIRETVHVFAQAHQFLAHPSPRAAVGSGRHTALGLRGVNGEARKALRQVVVQLAGEMSPLVFVGGDQPLAQAA